MQLKLCERSSHLLVGSLNSQAMIVSVAFLHFQPRYLYITFNNIELNRKFNFISFHDLTMTRSNVNASSKYFTNSYEKFFYEF